MPKARSSAFRNATKPCEVCFAPLNLNNSRDLERKRFCSQECKTASQVGIAPSGNLFKEIPTVCKRCSSDFLAINSSNTYCSKSCQTCDASEKYRSTHNTLTDHLYKLRIKTNCNRNLSLEFLLNLYGNQKGLCALSNVNMTWDILVGKVATNISIDRIDSSVGYTENNVQLVCHAVNIMKQQMLKPELVYWCNAILEAHNS